jgi:hypothetical protein
MKANKRSQFLIFDGCDRFVVGDEFAIAVFYIWLSAIAFEKLSLR